MTRILALTTIAGLTASGTALACGPEHRTPAPEATIELTHADANLPALLQLVGDHDTHESYHVRINDGDVTVIIDGQPVPADHVQIKNGTVWVMNHEGEWKETGARIATTPAAATTLPTPQRRVRLGVMLESVSGPLAAQLGVDGDQSILIQRVVEDSAAARAGLKDYDVIVRFDDEKGVNAERLRELLAAKNPGDSAKIYVKRGGEQKVFVVRFDDAGDTGGVAVAPSFPSAPRAPVAVHPQGQAHFFGHELDAETRAHMEEALAKAQFHAKRAQEQARELQFKYQGELKDGLAKLNDFTFSMELDDDAREQIKDAMATLRDQLADQGLNFNFDVEFEGFPRMQIIELDGNTADLKSDNGNTFWLRRGDAKAPADANRNRAVVLERQLSERARDSDDRVRRLERTLLERAERAEAMLERSEVQADRHIQALEERIERLEKLLEKALERLESDRPRGSRN